jgi:hypothetical protein
MGLVLLLDSDAEHANEIASVLRTISCQTVICSTLQTASLLLQTRAFESVVVSTRALDSDWRGLVDIIRNVASHLPEPPQIVCLLRGPYRGPAVRVYAARKGFKVIYEQ